MPTMAERRPRPPRYNAVVASAAVMTSRPPGLSRQVQSENWHDDVWHYYDVNGELRFGIGWIANGVSRVNLTAAVQPEQGGDEPTAVKAEPNKPLSGIDKAAAELVSVIAGDTTGQAQMMSRLAILLSVTGVGWVLIEGGDARQRQPTDQWRWTVLSNDELRSTRGKYEVVDAGVQSGWRELGKAHVLVKVWRSHARHANTPDSACRAALPVLRQISMIDDHILASAQSRLAGAGLLILPSEIDFTPLPSSTPPPADGVTPKAPNFVETLIAATVAPIADRGTAAAVVPLPVQMPGEWIQHVRHITFWGDFSDKAVQLRDAAIKRLALALDMPPEIVTGVSGMNHWGAWRVQEEAITLHIEPLAEIICHALTIGYLRPALLALKFPELEVNRRLVFFDVSDLTVRPDKSQDAGAAYDRIELSGSAYRREIGLSELDKPSEEERATRILLRTLERAPTFAPDLLAALGVNVEISEESNEQRPRNPTEREPERQIGGPPDSQDEEPIAASARWRLARQVALVEACDALVYRALERAGNRLRTEVARNKPGGLAVVACADPATLHVEHADVAWAFRDKLLAGAWDRAPVIAERYDLDPGVLTRTLDNYVRDLFVGGVPHELDELAKALAPTGVAA